MNRILRTLSAVALCVGIAVVGSPAGATVTGANGKIAFTNYDVELDAHRCSTINPDGTQEHQVGTGQVDCGTWSPDSSKILASVNPSGNARPATANPDGSDFTVLDHYPHLDQDLNCYLWSPDAARFLCGSDRGGNRADNGVYTLRSSDGGDLTRVTVTPKGYDDIALGYSPDGSRILFDRDSRHTDLGDVFTVNPNGTGLLRLNPPRLRTVDSEFGFNADWSPDGSRVVFQAYWKVSTSNGSQSALFVVNADGTGLHRITPFGLGARHGADWSPDGRLIAFATRFHNAHPQIWVVHPDGTGLREVTQPTHGDISVGPVWSPDSTKLVFTSLHPEINGGQANLWIVNADGTGLFQLTNPPEPLNRPSWGSAPS